MNQSMDEYLLGRTSAEYQRLRAQAKLWEESTRGILQKAGVRKGFSCLDVGCGPGEVMRLMGELVGESGTVTGIDIDGKIGQEALEILQATTSGNYAFHQLNVEESDETPGAPFDVVFARITLIHLKDPVATLQKMMRWTKPGGVVIVQEYDMVSWSTYPKVNELDEAIQTFLTVAEKGGRDVRLGTKLPAYFMQAGLGAPAGTDIAVMLNDLAVIGGRMTQAVYQSIFPIAQKLGLSDENKRHQIFTAIEEAMQAHNIFGLTPMLIGAWKQVRQ
jgi:ubiquinone/menaquinone biosynthesis C-methylase UbiE